jgi:hypothetical protein
VQENLHAIFENFFNHEALVIRMRCQQRRIIGLLSSSARWAKDPSIPKIWNEGISRNIINDLQQPCQSEPRNRMSPDRQTRYSIRT